MKVKRLRIPPGIDTLLCLASATVSKSFAARVKLGHWPPLRSEKNSERASSGTMWH